VQTVHDGLGNIFFGHGVNFQSVLLYGFSSSRANGRNMKMPEILLPQPKLFHSSMQRLDTIDAGEDEPIVVIEIV